MVAIESRIQSSPIAQKETFIGHGEPSMNENMLRFVRLVRAMRTAQKKYFATRNKEALSRSLDLEKKVDEQLSVMLEGTPEQGSLL